MLTPQIGSMAEDLLGVALEAAAAGNGTAGKPTHDNGIDLYFRRLRTLTTVPVQVKASLVVDQDGSATHYVPAADLRALHGGFVAFVHIPAPHDQLYQRIFLIPDDEFRKRCQLVSNHRVPCYKFTAQFAGTVDKDFAPFAIELDELQRWVAELPGWSHAVTPLFKRGLEQLTKAEMHDISGLGALWAQSELERVALDRIMLVEDRIRLDPVTFLVHDLPTQQFAGLHLRTAIFNKSRRIHFDVKLRHWFADPGLWVLLVLLRPDRRVHDFVLLIPSGDMAALGYSETLTLDPLTRRFRKYQLPSEDFGKIFMDKAFAARPLKGEAASSLRLLKAS